MQDGQPRRIQISTDMFPDQKRLALWRETRGRIAQADIDPHADDPLHADVTFNLLPNVAIASGARSPAHYRATRELLENASDIIAVSILRSGEASATQFGRESGEESIGGKCFAKCPTGTVRQPPGVACVALKPTGPACKDGQESIGGKCVNKCPVGTVRAFDGLACVAAKK